MKEEAMDRSSIAAAPAVARVPRLADHSADTRMLLLAGMALVVGTGGAASAWLLLHLIAIVTNLAWFGHFSVETALRIDSRLGVPALLVPIVGSVNNGRIGRGSCRESGCQ